MRKIKVGVIGPGNIGLDLLYKIKRSPYLETAMIVNVRESKGLDHARKMGIRTSSNGVADILAEEDIQIVFDCTSATAHMQHAPLLKSAGKFAIDLTPAAVGPFCVPAVNLTDDFLKLENVNTVTCAGQAVTPIVAAINEVADVYYAEIVSSVSSKSIGPGTRKNIDEFTVTTKEALEKVGGADEGKVIIIVNPAEPPIYMRNTIFTKVRTPDLEIITQAVQKMVEKIRTYVPGYEIILGPIIQGDTVTTMMQVAGLGDYLPVYSGNLDIINSAAINIAEAYAQKLMGGELNV